LILSDVQIGYLAKRRRLAEAADFLIECLREVADFKTVLEVGCGEGAFLSAVVRMGATRAAGIESFAPPTLVDGIHGSDVRIADYTHPMPLLPEEHFDLVICLELAQQVSLEQLETFIHSLAAAGDLVLFSAEIPGQNGDPRSPGLYLRQAVPAFRSRGFVLDDFFRPKHWHNKKAPFWAQVRPCRIRVVLLPSRPPS
jgi:hypothetical protein